MIEFYSFLLTIHLLAVLLLAGPFYALMAVNQRALLGSGFSYDVDSYLENIIRTHLTRCCVYNWTAMITGLILIFISKGSLLVIFSSWILFAKILLLAINMSMRGYARHIIQPKIDEQLAKASGDPVKDDIVSIIRPLRMLRKKLTVVCFLNVMLLLILGVNISNRLSTAGLIVIIFLVGAFTARAYNSTIKRGWF